MVNYVTKDRIKNLSKSYISEAKGNIYKSTRGYLHKPTSFLSHSSSDKEYISGVTVLLEQHGSDVYVDKKDPELPKRTNQETAKKLKERIGECKKFILFATKNSKDSSWVPWELGISDGVKGLENTAILPGVDSTHDTEWTEQEYLGIYNRIVYGKFKGQNRDVWMVWNHENNTAIELAEWLSR